MSLTKYILNEFTIGKPVLYHFTNPNSSVKIIESDALLIKFSVDDATSFTRSFQPKIKFKSAYSTSVRFTLDWNRLKDFYKIIPYMDGHKNFTSNPRDITKWYPTERWDFNRKREKFDEEAEERIEKDITNLHRFIIQIDINTKPLLNDDNILSQIESLVDLIEQNSNYHNIPVNIVDKWSPVKV